MKFMNVITCCLTIMLAFPFAGIICGGNESGRPSLAEFYPEGKEPPPLKQKNAKPARLFKSPCMKGVTLMDYTIQMTIDADEDLRGKSSGSSGDGGWSSTSSSGSVKYIPRIGIAAKNNPLKSGLLVIEYFSCETSDKSKSRRECVEHIPLPNIEKGKSLTVDASGVKFFKWEHKSKSAHGYNYKQGGGLELYGVIFSFYKDDKLLIQMCTHQLLTKECADTIPAPQEYEDSQSRHFYGW